MKRLALILLLGSAIAAHAATIAEMPSPAGVNAAEPFLSTTRDGVLLSWIEPVGAKHALMFARFANGKWSAPRTIVERDDLFVNWADFPSVIEDAKSVLYAHWLQKSGKSTYAYDVRMATSKDGGATWGKSFLLNRDGKQSEHGFVTLAALPNGGIGATWLDGRNMTGGDHDDHEGGGDMTLRYATIDANGAVANEVELDARTCECCTTGMAMTKNGPLITYRDRASDETRDISYVRLNGKSWSKPKSLRADGWKIHGCPVNGPQTDAIGNDAATAWFTAANGKQNVFVSFLNSASAITVDDGKPVGRVDVVMLDAKTALVTWLEQTETSAEIRARKVTSDGKRGPSIKVAESGVARTNGFTRITRAGNDVWFAWTDNTSAGKRVRVARGRGL